MGSIALDFNQRVNTSACEDEEMKKLIAVLAVLVSANASSSYFSYSSFESGNSLIELCESEAVAERNYCRGYLIGVTDLRAYQTEVGDNISWKSCPPEGKSIGQIEKIFVKWGNEHPEELHLGASE